MLSITLPNSISPISEPVEIRIVLPLQFPRSHFKPAYVLVSGRVYWKIANKDGTNEPQSIFDFRNANSLELVRLKDGNRNDVDEMVRVTDFDGRSCIAVHGRLHGRPRRKSFLLIRDVEVEIIPATLQQQEALVKQMQALVVPWNLLQQEMKDASGVEEIENALGQLPYKVEEKWGDALGSLPEQMQKLATIDDAIAHGSAAVETGATLVNMVATVERVAETAEFIADVSKCVAGVSTVFHLVALSAQGVAMWAEANRGQRVLPVVLGQMTVLLRYVLESLAEISKPSREKNETDVDFVFNTFKETVCIIDGAKIQLLRGRGSRIMNAENVKEVEDKLEELIHRVVTAGTVSKIHAVDEKVNQLEGRENGDDGPHHVRPSVSPFFSGRKKELETLKGVLDRWGSAVITQYGGVGKTELMVALADRAERDGQVPGGVFWVTVDGGERGVIGSLAGLAEKLTKRKISEEDRRNVNLVIAALTQGLSKRRGRWLLCLDNADDISASGILNEVCGIAGPSRENGWIVVTSRQGKPHIWNRMKSEQKLALEPLCAEDAMVALWRQIRKIETADADDATVMAEIKELERNDQAEYSALERLCADEEGCGLGGLPLAIVQAGSFIAQYEKSFAEYLNLFESAVKEDWEKVTNKTDEVKPIQNSQRSIWTTWKISVDKLSGKAYKVLQALALLGQGVVGETIVKEILRAAASDGGDGSRLMFESVIQEELMHGSSLIRCEREGGKGKWKCSMHRLVRRFILDDMTRGSVRWNIVYSLTLLAVHEVVKTELEKKGYSFRKLPDVFESNHRELSANSIALIHHYVLPPQGKWIQHGSEMENIHQFTGMVLGFMEKWEEQGEVWEHLLDILHRQEPEHGMGTQMKSRIAGAKNSLGNALLRAGKYKSAASKLKHSLKLYEEVHGHDEPSLETASTLNNLGHVYREMGKLDEALEKHELCLKMRQEIHGHDEPHLDIALSFNNLAIVYHEMGRLEEALEKHEQCLTMNRRIYGNSNSHPRIAMSFTNLGLLYLKMGKLEEARKKQKQALEMEKEIYRHSMPHPAIAMSVNNLANVYLRMGELEKALDLHEQSLQISRLIYGSTNPHPVIARSLGNLGLVYHENGDLYEALEKHERSLKMYQEIHGQNKEHSDIASALYNIGSLYDDMGELDESLERHGQALEMRCKIYGHGKSHLKIASSLHSLGNVLRKMGKLEEAMDKHEKGLKMYQTIHGHGATHLDIAISLNDLGLLYRQMGNLDEALAKHEQSLGIYQAIHGHEKSHSDIALSLNNLGHVYFQMNRLVEAKKKHEQSLDMRRKIHGDDKPHLDIASSLENLGRVYFLMRRLDKAKEKFEQSLDMRRKIHGDGKPNLGIASSLGNLGSVYEAMGELHKALEMLQESLKMRCAIRGHNKLHLDIALSLDELGSLHRKMSEPKKALQKYEESLKMRRALLGHDTAHRHIALSLTNIGLLYLEMDKLDKALENLKQSLEMYRAIHGNGYAHLDILSSLFKLGIVYEKKGDLDKAAVKYEESLKMRKAVDGLSEPRYETAATFNSLGNIYRQMGKLEKAIEMHEQSLKIFREIYGDGESHPDIALSLSCIGAVHHMLKNLNQAAEYLEQSLEMLQIVHGRNSTDPSIETVRSFIVAVREDLGKKQEALAIAKRNTETDGPIDGEMSNRSVGN